MGESCTLKAHVRNPQGDMVESKLYNDLLHYTSNDRVLSNGYYNVGTNKEFLNEKARDYFEEHGKELHFDENGEILLTDLLQVPGIDFEVNKLAQVLNNDLGNGVYSYQEAINRIQDFNRTSSFADQVVPEMVSVGKDQYRLSVTMKKTKVKDKLGREVEVDNTADAQKKLYNTVRNAELEKRIVDLLRRHHVSVKFIEEAKEGGRYSTENIIHAENGLYGLIEVSNGGRVTDVLAEEAGHFAVGALGDNPLVKRLEELLKDEAVQKAAIGEEDYDRVALGENPAREIAGRLVGKVIQNQLHTGTSIKILAQRIYNTARRIFANIKGDELERSRLKAEHIANKIAYQFIDGSGKFKVDNALSIKETLHDATYTPNQQVFKKVSDELGRMVKTLEAVSKDNITKTFSNNMKGAFAWTMFSAHDTQSEESALQMKIDMQADAFALDGIVQALIALDDVLGPDKELNNMLDIVDEKNQADFYSNIPRNARKLRQVRTFVRSAKSILDIVNFAYQNSKFTLANGTTLDNLQYQDEQGVWHTFNMGATIRHMQYLLDNTTQLLKQKETLVWVKFLEQIYGDQYVTTSVGRVWSDIWNKTPADEIARETSYSIKDLVEGKGVSDIDIFHRFLGSMANNPDIIGQIADKVVRTANKAANDLTARYQDKLQILKKRADDIGFDTTDLIERDENGVPTGDMITPPPSRSQNGGTEEDFICDVYDEMGVDDPPAVSYSKWEKARDEFKKAKWEEFKELYPDWAGWSGWQRGIKWDEFMRTSTSKNPSMKEWNNQNSIKIVAKDEDGNTKYTKWIPNANYASYAFEDMLDKYSPEKQAKIRAWVTDYRQLKSELDRMLPQGATTSQRLPQFRGTFTNSVRNSVGLQKGILGGRFKKSQALVKTFGRRAILESFVQTSEDTDYGDLNTMNNPDEELLGTRLDYEDERVDRLPIFGVNKLKNLADLSTDIFHSTLAYASMATTYQCLDNVVDALEVGRQKMYDRKLTAYTVKSAINETRDKAKAFLGETHKKPTGEYEVIRTGEKNRAYNRYIKFLDEQVYGISATDWGFTTRGGQRILLNKVIQNLSALAGDLFLKGNILGGAVNTSTGFLNVFKESVSCAYFTPKDWLWAHKYYFSSIGSMIYDYGRLHKDNRLDMFLYEMDFQGDVKGKYKEWYTTRSWAHNVWNQLGYLPYSSGDHYMQSMAYLAIAHGTKLYDENGKEISNLWEAYKKVENKDELSGTTARHSLEFDRLNPLSSEEITADALNKKGVYLKKNKKHKKDFEDWLIWQDERFLDERYKNSHAGDDRLTGDKGYNTYRDEFTQMSDKECMQFQVQQYGIMKNILEKVETYLNSNSPLMSVPSFSDEEKKYLRLKGVDTQSYEDIQQQVREDIYYLIWNKSDETSYMSQSRELNNRLHGIYNKQDKTAWHQNWFFNAVLAMRGWALGMYEQTFSNNHYSVALGRNVEGSMFTALKTLTLGIQGGLSSKGGWKGWAASMGKFILSISIPWSPYLKRQMLMNGFSEEQHNNMKRVAALVWLMVILKLINLATAIPPKDDDDKGDEEHSALEGFLYYLSMRTLIEQEALMNPIEIKQLTSIWPVGFEAAYDLGKLLYEGGGAMFGDSDDSDFFYQRDANDGRYEEGDTKFEHHLERLLPYYKSIWAMKHPHEAAENYQFGRKMISR